MPDTPIILEAAETARVLRAAAIAGEQLRLAKQVVSDGGFAGAGAGPLLVGAVLQAMAINYLATAPR